ncbi:MAG: M28 family peptidase [Methanobacteriaceae archaeon]|nr:M28 family peptidase [Methanobacteriaceae archaeon]
MYKKTFLIILLIFTFFISIYSSWAATDLLPYVEHISKDIGPRPAGSMNEKITAEYMAYHFRENGLKTEIQNFKYYIITSGQVKSSQNVIGIIEGVSDKEIIICADLDTVKDYNTGNYSQGANDVAVPLSILIGLAQKYKDKKPYYTIKLIAFGAGEDGFTFPLLRPERHELSPDIYYQVNYLPYLVGSRYYLLTHQDMVGKTVAVVSLEALGIGEPYLVSKDYYTENNPSFINFLILYGNLKGYNLNKIEFMASKMPGSNEAAISHVYLPFSIAKIPSTFLTSMKNPNTSSTVHDTKNEMPYYLSSDDTFENLVKENGGRDKLEKNLEERLYLVENIIDGSTLFNMINNFPNCLIDI